ncbi:MAG: hypothetical protein KGL79_04375 [Acidobacteriota bacterium]|nr:hypothetical protein [Acidobacteriota bacterium]
MTWPWPWATTEMDPEALPEPTEVLDAPELYDDVDPLEFVTELAGRASDMFDVAEKVLTPFVVVTTNLYA